MSHTTAGPAPTTNGGDTKKMAQALEEACQDFLAHCKDHRSLDVIDLSVERVYQAQCSACGREWETDRREDGVEQCASCGVEAPHA